MNESEKDKLDALIVRNLQKVNVALSRIWYGIGPHAFKAIDAASKDWTEAQGWKGEFGSEDDELLWFAPPEWTASGLHDGIDGHYAYFQLDTFADEHNTEGGDQDRLVTLLGTGVGSTGFRIIRGDDAAVTKPAWRRLASSNEVLKPMVSLGFVHEDGGSYFLPIPFKAEALAEGIEQGDMSDFLAPLEEALGKLPDAMEAMRPVIDVASRSTS